MAYGQTHSETIPTVSSTEGEEFATMVNAVLTEMRATLDAKVTPAGIDINADLSMRSGATYYGVTNAHRLSLRQQSALLSASTYPASVYSNAAGELYYNDASGNQIALTSSGSIAGSAGSISGSGYGSSGVEVNWDSGASDYHFYSASATYADINAAALQLSDGSSNFLRMVAASMASDYTVTWPAAVPASTSVLHMSSAGALSVSRALSVDTLATSSTIAATGLITATAGLTAAADAHVTVSGTGKYKHGTRTIVVPGPAFIITNPVVGNWNYDASSGRVVNGSATDIDLVAPVMLPAGKRIVTIQWSLNHGSGASTRSYKLVRRNLGAGTNSELVALTDATNGGGAFQISAGAVSHDILADYMYFLVATVTEADDRVYAVELGFSEP